MSRLSALKMIKRRARKVGLPTEICAHSFRGTGITEYLRNGGDLEVAARIAGHESTRTHHAALQPAARGDLARRDRTYPHLSACDDGRTTQASRTLSGKPSVVHPSVWVGFELRLGEFERHAASLDQQTRRPRTHTDTCCVRSNAILQQNSQDAGD